MKSQNLHSGYVPNRNEYISPEEKDTDIQWNFFHNAWECIYGALVDTAK